MKVISYSLWGDNPKYLKGAIKNAILAKEIYPDWKPVFFIHDKVDNNTKIQLINNGATVFIFKSESVWAASLYRLLPINYDGVTHVIFRDCDGRLSTRESLAVREWEKSDKFFHIMRDHPAHCGYPILAGMFGCKSLKLEGLEKGIEENLSKNYYHADQDFISKHLWPIAKESSMIHDEFYIKNPFPSKRNNLEYVGEPFDENDIPCCASHRESLKNSL